MKIAVFSDVHSCYLKMVAVFKDMEEFGVDQYICLGDIIGYGDMPEETVQLLIEKKVVELAGQDKSTSEIGTMMRDTFGVPDVKLSTGKKVNRILKENNAAQNLPEDFTNLITKALRLRKHLDNNHKDKHNKRALNLTESKVRRLGKYYRRKKILPVDWKYDPQTAERLITS